MATNLPRFDQETLANNSGQNVSRVNHLARLLDAFLGEARVIDRDLLAEPGSPAEGDLYLLPASGTLTGTDWSTFTNGNLAWFVNGAWIEVTVDAAMEGVQLRVIDEGRSLTYTDGEGWVEMPNSVETGITASTTQTQGQQPLTARVSHVAVVANANDVVTLPAAVAGLEVVVLNAGANALQVFPASGDDVDDGATDASVTLATSERAVFCAIDGTSWYSLVGVSA